MFTQKQIDLIANEIGAICLMKNKDPRVIVESTRNCIAIKLAILFLKDNHFFEPNPFYT